LQKDAMTSYIRERGWAATKWAIPSVTSKSESMSKAEATF
jgi:hypothetical protein